MPFPISPFPIDLPDITTANIAGLGNRTLDPLRFVSEIRPPQEDLNLLSLDALTFPDLVAEMKWRTTMGPEDPLDLLCECGDLVLSKCHA